MGVGLMSLLLVVLAVVFFMCIQAGLFHKINIKTTRPEFGELVVMYKCGRGAYSESGTLFTQSHSLMPQYNTIGVYYDDPEKKTSENLRYIVGLVLSEGGAPVKAEDETLLVSHGYKKVVFPALKHAVVADFPYRSTLSCIFAVFRVYPALREYVERRELCAHPIVELYDNSTSRILFAGPLEQQDSFYVPDVLEDPDVVSSPGEESCEDEDGERKAVAAISEEDEGSAAEEEERSSVRGGSEQRLREGDSGWEKSASLLAEEGDTARPEVTGSVPQGSAEESDTNTGSSFEEIDPAETVALPSDDSPALPSNDSPAPSSQPLEAATPVPATPVPAASITPPLAQEPLSAQEAELKETPVTPSSNDGGQGGDGDSVQ